MRQSFLPYVTMEKPYTFQRAFHSSLRSTMDGLEVARDRPARISMGEVELLTRRHEGMQRTKDIIYEQIVNNQFPMDESEFIVKCLEKRADFSLRQTCVDGKRVSKVLRQQQLRELASHSWQGKTYHRLPVWNKSA
jgi:hypothetical protein